MGHQPITLKLPPDYQEEDLRSRIKKELHLSEFTCHIEKKSLDARKRSDIHWLVRLSVVSDELKGVPLPTPAPLDIPHRKGRGKAVVVGAGPAGFFSALVRQKSGFETTLIDQGPEVQKRADGIREFEKTGVFNPFGNYAFGEGGAGTFSDGKLTSRTKNIEQEKQFVLGSYIRAGAPHEIAYLAHPHIGSDNLKGVMVKLREEFQSIGGTVLFETKMEDLVMREGKVVEVVTSKGNLDGTQFVIAPGHSAYDTYRMLIRRGVRFRTKGFAIGSRMEHRQEIINRAQWGQANVPGLKAAEYRLASKGDGNLPVFTFCMCPGGRVVPATAAKNTSVVNGMSFYARGGPYANAGCVAGINPEQITGRETTPEESLDWLEALEEKFYTSTGGFQLPFCGIRDFIDEKVPAKTVPTSYPLGLKPAPLWELLPKPVSQSLRAGLRDFNSKMRGFETGILMGLESKTSSPIQAVREENGLCAGFDNLSIVGEGSGYAGGIISSAVDGIKKMRIQLC